MNATTEVVMQNKLYFPTLCIGVGVGHGCKTLEVEVELSTQICRDWDTMEEKRMYVFSASGSGMGWHGQCLDHLKDKAFEYIMPQEKQALFERVFEIWKEYHLNDMQSGTIRQTEALLEKDKTLHYATNYKQGCDYLKSINLYKDNGYKYGHGWLCKPIPTEIVEEILSWGAIKSEPREAIEAMRRALRREYAKQRKEGKVL
jgi:hypothetical protein